MIKNLRARLRKSTLEQIWEEFFNIINTIEIDLQLQGLSINNRFKAEDADDAHFTFEERARLAPNLFMIPNDESPDQLLHRCMQVIKDWASLCRLQSVPSMRKGQAGGSSESKAVKDTSDDIILADLFPLVCSPTQCLFCLGNEGMSLESRTFSFSHIDHLHRHIRDFHLQHNGNVSMSFPCPHPACSESCRVSCTSRTTRH